MPYQSGPVTSHTLRNKQNKRQRKVDSPSLLQLEPACSPACRHWTLELVLRNSELGSGPPAFLEQQHIMDLYALIITWATFVLVLLRTLTDTKPKVLLMAELPLAQGKLVFCSGQAVYWWKKAHPHYGRQSALLKIYQFKMLISSNNVPKETPRMMFDWTMA